MSDNSHKIPEEFWAYMSTAEEIYDGFAYEPGIPLEDLDPEFVREAKEAAEKLGLPWPPDLPTAEERLNDYRRKGME